MMPATFTRPWLRGVAEHQIRQGKCFQFEPRKIDSMAGTFNFDAHYMVRFIEVQHDTRRDFLGLAADGLDKFDIEHITVGKVLENHGSVSLRLESAIEECIVDGLPVGFSNDSKVFSRLGNERPITHAAVGLNVGSDWMG